MNPDQHIDRAVRAMTPSSESYPMPTENDIETAKAHALISIAQSLADLVNQPR